MGKFIDITGKKFGKLTVIERAPLRRKPNGGTMTMWKCRCDCGTEKVVWVENLKRGATISCGCHKNENTSKRNYKHGYRYSRIYRIWLGMRARCAYKSQSQYYRYGGRGIRVCEEWDNDFIAFYDWAMTNGYSDKLSIDRINNDGNYEPSNCRWVTIKVQAQNKSSSAIYEYDGKNKSLCEWSKIFNTNCYNFYFHQKKGRSFTEYVNQYVLREVV